MADSLKKLTQKDSQQSIRAAYNDANDTLGVDGFITGLVGRKVVRTVATTNVTGDTSVFDFSENGNLLYEITVVYTDATQDTFISAERTA